MLTPGLTLTWIWLTATRALRVSSGSRISWSRSSGT